MTSTPFTEADIIQNTALSAALVWRCGIGHQDESHHRPMELHLAFLVLPVCLHRNTLDILLSTQQRSGLSLFASKIARQRENLMALHDRTLSYRTLTLEAIGTGVRAKLLTVDYVRAKIRANESKTPTHLPERIKPLMRGAERFGVWCSRLSLEEITATLRIEV